LSNIGVVLFEQDRLRDATAYYKESLAICREIGDKRGLARALHNLAIVEREKGNLADARAGYDESIALRAQIGDKRGEIMARVELGTLLLATGDVQSARQQQERALHLAGETQLKLGQAQALFQLGQIATVSADLAAARAYYTKSLDIRRQMNETRTIPESELALAELAFYEGRVADAETEAVRLSRSLDNERGPLRVGIELLIARTRLDRRDLDGAARALSTARQLGKGTERIETRRMIAMVQAELDAARGRTIEARRRLNELRPVLERAGLVLAELERRMVLLQIDSAEGRPNAARHAAALQQEAQARHAGLVAKRIRVEYGAQAR
jgi:hypothetical protein